MKYAPHVYARAFAAVIAKGEVSSERALKQLVQVVERYGDTGSWDAIVREVRKVLVHDAGGRLVRIEMARVVPKALIQSIQGTFAVEDDISLAVRPELIAGMRVVVDDELELDGSLQHKLNVMFTV
jgi:hypothetical protein